MGRDVAAVPARFADGEDVGRLQWEAPRLVFRGATRRVFEGIALRGVAADGGDLVLGDGSRFTLGAVQAARWASSIANPPGRLDKLGVKAGMRVAILDLDEPGFEAELAARAILTNAFNELDMLILGADSPEQLDRLPRKEITEKSLSHSRLIVLKDKQEVIDFTNLYAPEHLIIQTTDYADIAGQVENAGSVFMGSYTPESAGDYASGTNHTLPTNGYAKAYSGVNLDSFIKKITFQEITADGIRLLGGTIRTMAANEQLDAHKNAVTIRLNTL